MRRDRQCSSLRRAFAAVVADFCRYRGGATTIGARKFRLQSNSFANSFANSFVGAAP
jgi:hypothetical protein